MIDVVSMLRVLERQGEDNIWRTAKEAREEIERLREALEPFAAIDLLGCRLPPEFARNVLQARGALMDNTNAAQTPQP